MFLEEFMRKIGLSEEEQLAVTGYKMGEVKYFDWKTLFYEDLQKFFRQLQNSEDKEMLALYLYVRFAVELEEKYKKCGISQEVYFQTFSDIAIWSSHYRKKSGKLGLQEVEWLARHLQCKLYRLGRLQFEKDDTMLHIHIPEGEPLSEEECDLSFQYADDFFSGKYIIYDCQSWILDPILKTIMDDTSNMIRFQNRFQIHHVIAESHQAEERVFGRVLEQKEQYPEKTSLQKKMKRLLLEGKQVGEGYGIIDRKKEQKNETDKGYIDRSGVKRK